MHRHLSFPYMLALWVLIFPLLAFLMMVDDYRESELTARIGWLILLASFAYIVRVRWFYLLLLVPFFITGVIDLFYTFTFHEQFESPLFRVLTDTDVEESIEFLSNYLGVFNSGVLLLYLFGFAYLSSKVKFFPASSFKGKLLLSAGALMLIVAVQQIWFHERFKDVLPGAFGQVVDGYNKYRTLQQELIQRPQLLEAYQKPVVKQSEKPQTYVVVIGESSSRKHHSLFGYQRDTNPKLTSLADELILFDDVLSPFAVTYLSLSYTLTQKRVGQDLEFTKALSTVGLAKKAGFKTWWISAQPKYEGTTLSISTVADKTIYLNDQELKDAAVLDEVKTALKDPAQHKVIYVHIRGSHMTYDKRYPESFNYFKSDEGVKIYTPSPSTSQIETINAYDNSVLFTDYVLSELIGAMKRDEQVNQSIAGMVYFADHGEEVYDYKDFIGHELKRVTPVMFEIPFVVWTNQNYQQIYKDKVVAMQKNKHQPFLNDDFFDFGLCFMGIETELGEEAVSPCELYYEPKERRVAGKLYQSGKLLD